MKTALLFLWIGSAVAFGQMQRTDVWRAVAAQQARGGGSQTFTLKDTQGTGSTYDGTGSTDENEVGDNSADQQTAYSFTPSSSYTLTRIDANLTAYGTPTGTLTLTVWSDSGSGASSVPLSQLSFTPNTVAMSSVTTAHPSTTFYTFSTATGLALTSGTRYWISIKTSTVSSANYIGWGCSDVTGTVANNGPSLWANICAAPCVLGNIKAYTSP